MKERLLIPILFGISLCWISPASWAAVADLGNHETLKESKDLLEKKEWQQRRVLSSLSKLNLRIQKVLKEKSELSNRGFVVRNNVASLSNQVQDLEQKKIEKRSQVRSDLKMIKQIQAGAYQHILLNSYSSSQLNQNIRYLNAILERNFQSFKDYDRLVKELSQKQISLVKESRRLKRLNEAFDKKETTLRKELVVKNKILDGIKRSRIFVEQKLEDLRKKAEVIEEVDTGILDAITRPHFARQQGVLPSPVSGRVARSFGPYHTGERQITLNSKGVFLEAPLGSSVRAVFSGVVSYVGVIPGLDQILVLDHGDHYFTVYGQLVDISVKPGEVVSQSQIIARSGQEKFKNLNGIYFEIRHFSEPYNPTDWVRGLTL